MKTLIRLSIYFFLIIFASLLNAQNLDKTSERWEPIEWSFANSSYSGNPFDLIATVTFNHSQSGETRRTEMFYAGDNIWKFRFTGTQEGIWTFNTSSTDGDLDGRSGTIIVTQNQNGDRGFVTNLGEKWVWSSTNEAFIPQFVMYTTPNEYFDRAEKIDNDIQTFFVEHGFNGFHTSVNLSWFKLGADSRGDIDEPSPDFRTFEALELLILKTYAEGGVVHIWAWGDEERGWTPAEWGLNGTEDKRLQRYIAARLAPLPGWTMSYGFDLFEWANESVLNGWHDYIQDHMGWPHFLGARAFKNSLDQISERMDYSSYEQHRPDYYKYVETIERRPSKPSFSEDRFRVRNEGREKDYNMEDTRRGLWHSAMAGGVANIWGYLIGAAGYYSTSYPNPEQIKTYSLFFANRFKSDMSRANNLTDGFCLKRSGDQHYVFYKENTSSVQIELSEMSEAQPVIAVDTKKAYQEINLGQYQPGNHTWDAPYPSDWAIAVGVFTDEETFGDTTAPLPPNGLRIINGN